MTDRAHPAPPRALTSGVRRTGPWCTTSTSPVPAGRITVMVGANACGKSTLLRGLARLLRPTAGAVLLDGRAIHDCRPARSPGHSGLLPQTPVAPEGITVTDLVGRGRYPHQGWFRRWTAEDDEAVARRWRHRHAGPGRPARRRAVRRPAPAGVDRDGAGAGDGPAAARRADDLPRRGPPGRGAGPARSTSTATAARRS